MDIALIAPADAGAGSYNARIAQALGRAGHFVTRHAPDDDAPGGGVVVIDGILLPAFEHRAERLTGAVALVHHPGAADPALSDRERERVRAIHRALLPAFRRVMTSSASAAERLAAEYGVDSARVSVVTPGVDDVPRATGSGEGCHVVSLGTLTPRKGYDVVLQALARLTDLDWRLTIAGAARPAGYATTIGDMADALGIAGRVRLAGALEDDAMEAVWASADLFALATRWEAHGTAVAQALRRGVPLAVTEGAANGVAVPPDAGVVCAEDSLSRALRRLILNGGLRRQFADAAYAAGRILPTWDEQARALLAAVA